MYFIFFLFPFFLFTSLILNPSFICFNFHLLVLMTYFFLSTTLLNFLLSYFFLVSLTLSFIFHFFLSFFFLFVFSVINKIKLLKEKLFAQCVHAFWLEGNESSVYVVPHPWDLLKEESGIPWPLLLERSLCKLNFIALYWSET